MVTAGDTGLPAICMRKWKYITNTPQDNSPENRIQQLKNFQPQLYNLSEDPSEEVNLYIKKPDIVKKLKEELESIRRADVSR